MDRQRFDELTKMLGKSTSRRQVLKGLAGAALGGLLAQMKGEEATAKPKPPKPPDPDHCRPEGHKSKDPGRCCSLASSGDICCAVGLGDPCAVSGCCGDTSICENGGCCLPEGAFLGDNDVTACCSESAMGDVFQVCCARGIGDSCAVSRCCGEGVCFQGTCVECLPEGANFETEGYDINACCSQVGFPILDICCGEADGSCASSRCCAGDQVCHQDTCVDCLPEGENPTFPDDCCSGTVQDERCCGEENGSCATSGCCSGAQVCHESTCVDCLEEGVAPSEPTDCCSGTVQEDLCCGEENGSCATSGCCSGAQVCHEGACIDCLPEGVATDEFTDCCSGVTQGGVCCAEGSGGDSCAASNCCHPTSAFPICHNGVCVDCLPEGESPATANDCCSGTVQDDLCCGEENGSCAVSGCCSGAQVCHQGVCVDCLEEGVATSEPSDCCSGVTSGGVCCAIGSGGDSCAASGCCHPTSAFPICHNGVCVDCLPDGAPTGSAFDCCSLASSGGICCGEIGGSCSASGCCEIGGICCNGTCHEPCPEGQPRDPDTCVCEPRLEDGESCIESGECLSAACCGGICVNSQTNPAHCGACDSACPAGEICQGGQCGRRCSDGTFCESGLNCICTSGSGCVCCAACPAGSEVPTSTNCRGGCGDCCEPCFHAGGFICCGPFKETLNPSAGCRNGPFR